MACFLKELRAPACSLLVSIRDRLIDQCHKVVADRGKPAISHDCSIELQQQDSHQILLGSTYQAVSNAPGQKKDPTLGPNSSDLALTATP